jgi:hypothetical protein
MKVKRLPGIKSPGTALEMMVRSTLVDRFCPGIPRGHHRVMVEGLVRREISPGEAVEELMK